MSTSTLIAGTYINRGSSNYGITNKIKIFSKIQNCVARKFEIHRFVIFDPLGSIKSDCEIFTAVSFSIDLNLVVKVRIMSLGVSYLFMTVVALTCSSLRPEIRKSNDDNINTSKIFS